MNPTFLVECFTGKEWIVLFRETTEQEAEKKAAFMRLGAVKESDVRVTIKF
jgi:hypothetical protein